MTPSWAALVVLTPFLAAVVLAGLPRRWGERVNLAASVLGFGLACVLPWTAAEPGGLLLASPAGILAVLLNGVLGVAAALFSRAAAPPGRLRLYHASFQLILGSAHVAVLADNAAVTWLALEAASAALLVASAAAQPSPRAAWPALLLLGAPLALAGFGTVLLGLAATPALGPGWNSLRWSALLPASPACDGAVLSLAFVLLLLGYGGLAALAPLQGWLLEVQDRAPVALGGVLAGTLPVVALILILRLRGVVDGNAQAMAPGGPMMALGLAALLVSAAGLWRAQPGRRWLALSSSGQNGLAVVAFGLGGTAGALAGLLHLAAHAMVKAAAFQGEASRHAGAGRAMAGLSLAALAGLPPFGLFSSLVLITGQAAQLGAWLWVPLVVGIAASGAALMLRMPPGGSAEPARLQIAGMGVCLAGALLLGLAMPGPLAAWLAKTAALAR